VGAADADVEPEAEFELELELEPELEPELEVEAEVGRTDTAVGPSHAVRRRTSESSCAHDPVGNTRLCSGSGAEAEEEEEGEGE